MGTPFWTPKSSKNIYPSTNSHWETPNAHPFLEKIFNLFTYLQWEGYFLSLFSKIPLTYLEWENVFGNPKSKIFLTNSHRDTFNHKGVVKNRHKKRRLSFDKRQTNCWISKKMITQMNFCFDFLLLYLRRRGIIQKKTLNTMCYRLLEVGHWNIRIL